MTTATQTRAPITMAAVGLRMGDIAQAAETIRQLAFDAQQAVGQEGNPGQLAALIQAIGATATNAGILADMTSKDVGSCQILGDAAAWLLTPAERQEATPGQ
jgi:hypothetical protein